ncbi:hypothetical protein C8R45DRAFT_936353 [Mycena sanguinolenta]|nr:hypothetical protein C8R45DRAFT_936353 [Mycena sanguinolenta]
MILSRFDSSGFASINSDILATRFCLGGLLRLRQSKVIPLDAFAELWVVVWPWIEFLDECEESLGVDKAPAMAIYDVFVSLIRFFHDDKSAAQVIDSTPGVHMVIARAWRHFVNKGPETGISNVSYFIGRLWKNPTSWDSAAFEELIVGAGGTRMDLASVVVSHLRRVFPHPYSRVTSDTVFYLIPIIYLVANHQDPAFKDALSLCGIVTALTTSARALCRSSSNDVAMQLQPLFSVLIQQISPFPPRWVSAQPLFIPRHSFNLKPPLHKVLSAYWLRVGVLVESRVRILDEHRGGAFTSTRACLSDWRRGGHRQMCRPRGTLFHVLSPSFIIDDESTEYSHISSGDQSFFLALVLHAYTTSKQEEIAEKRLLFMEQHSNQIPYIMFDFTTGSCEIDVGPSEDLPSEFAFEIERTVRSGGQIQLHLVKVLDGTHAESSVSRIWPFSLRIGSTAPTRLEFGILHDFYSGYQAS